MDRDSRALQVRDGGSTELSQIETSASQQLAEQKNQFDITGGEFVNANFGPQNYHLTRQEGIVNGNFQGAHFGPRNIQQIQHVYVNKRGRDEDDDLEAIHSAITDLGAKRQRTTENGSTHLSSTIIMFHSKKLCKGGNVYEGEQTSEVYGPQKIAIKLIPFDENNIREAKFLLLLSPHANVASLIHSDVYPQCRSMMYTAIELCHTENLYDHIKGSPASTSRFVPRMKWAKQLTEGLCHIHGHDIIHRDLKPHNVLLSLNKQDVKITDFGLSKQLRSGRSETAQSTRRIGTDGYRAPETYNSDIISLRADIFSLGLVLHFIWSDGGHAFGDDPDLWNYNIKKGKNFSLEGLRVTHTDRARQLLRDTFNYDPKQRPVAKQISHMIDDIWGREKNSQNAPGQSTEASPSCQDQREHRERASNRDPMSVSPNTSGSGLGNPDDGSNLIPELKIQLENAGIDTGKLSHCKIAIERSGRTILSSNLSDMDQGYRVFSMHGEAYITLQHDASNRFVSTSAVNLKVTVKALADASSAGLILTFNMTTLEISATRVGSCKIAFLQETEGSSTMELERNVPVTIFSHKKFLLDLISQHFDTNIMRMSNGPVLFLWPELTNGKSYSKLTIQLTPYILTSIP